MHHHPHKDNPYKRCENGCHANCAIRKIVEATTERQRLQKSADNLFLFSTFFFVLFIAVMPAQAIPDLLDIPPFKHLALYTGNVMRTSVAGRNKVLSKKSNTEASYF